LERDQLLKMRLEALRLLAKERGLSNADELPRQVLIERLSTPSRLVERAREFVANAAQRLEKRVHAFRNQLSRPTAMREAAQPPAESNRRPPARPAFDVPSSTVHPHAEELETLSMAQRFAKDGQIDRAVEIYEKLCALDPSDEGLRGALALLRPPQPPQPQKGSTPPSTPPREPFGMLDFQELPETYGVDECEVLFRDPFTIFCYWEVTEPGLERARQQLGQNSRGARLVLRQFHVSDGERAVHDVALSWNHGRRYIQLPRAGVQLRIAVGLLSQEGYFAPIAHSSQIRLPPAEPSAEIAVEWMEVVPGKSRGRSLEPLVIVRRDVDHTERVLSAPQGGRPIGVPTGRPPRQS
jgi:hypothetical protein